MTIVPKLERKEWHEKALDGAATGAELGSLPELFTATNETERLAKLVRGSSHEALKNVSRSFTEPAAKRLEKTIQLAAFLWCAQGIHKEWRRTPDFADAQGMRIVDEKESKYYDASLSNFEHARCCYQRAGLATEWEKTGRRVSSFHLRKSGLHERISCLAAGAKRVEQPSFLERARARWGERHRNQS